MVWVIKYGENLPEVVVDFFLFLQIFQWKINIVQKDIGKR